MIVNIKQVNVQCLRGYRFPFEQNKQNGAHELVKIALSVFGATIVGTVIGGASNHASQLIGGKSFAEINWLTMGASAAVGGIAGLIGGPGAKNRAKIDNAINSSSQVANAQNSVAKVGDKMANGLYATARGAKSAYTQVMNRLSDAIFGATAAYSRSALIGALASYGVGTAAMSGFSFIPALR